MGTEDGFPALRMLRALKVGGARADKDEWPPQQSREREPCQTCHLLSAHCCLTGMQAPHGLASEVLREAENPDSSVKFLNF